PFLFFYTTPAPTTTYTLSLHDALPIYWLEHWPCPRSTVAACGFPLACRQTRQSARSPGSNRTLCPMPAPRRFPPRCRALQSTFLDRKSTRLNSSHVSISYAVFCLKKKI